MTRNDTGAQKRKRSARKVLTDIVNLWDRGILQVHEMVLSKSRTETIKLFEEASASLAARGDGES